MSNYGQNPYGQNPYGQPQPPQNPYGQPQQYGRPQQNPYGQPQQPQNPYGQQQSYGQQGYPQQQQQLQHAAPPETLPAPEMVERQLPVMTMEQVPNATITQVLGEVIGVIARSRELPNGARGGRPAEAYGAYLTRSRQEAVTTMVEMARAAGADAVVGLRFDCSEITQSLSEVSAYGTAVLTTDQVADQGRHASSPPTPDRVPGGAMADEVRDVHSDDQSGSPAAHENRSNQAGAADDPSDDIAHLRPRGWDQPGQPQQGDPYRPSWPPQA